MKKIKFGFFFLLIVFTCKSQDTVRLRPIDVFGIKAYNKIPVTKTDIDKDILQKNYYGNDIPTLLSRTPNITYYSDGGNYSGYMYYRIRGIDQTRINSTLDGIPLNEPEDQGAYFSNYPDFRSNINSIQIQRGIGISTNGTSSYAGSLGFESINLLDSQYRSVDATISSFKSRLYGATYNSGLKDNFAFYGRFSKINSDGYRDHSGTDGSTFFFSAGYYKSKIQLKFISFFGKSENEQAYLATDENILKLNRKYNPLSPSEKDNFYQNFNSLQLIYSFNKWKFSSSIYYNKLIGIYGVLIDSVMSNFGLTSNFYGWMANIKYQKNNFTAYYGTHINFYNRQHITTYDLGQIQYQNIGYKNEQSSFLKFLYQIEKLNIYSDVQLRNVSYLFEKQSPYLLNIPTKDWLFFNWRFGLNYELKSNLFLYSFIGQSHKEPTRTDLLANFDDIDSTNIKDIGNFNRVKPERVTDIEFGFNYADHQKSIKVNYFNMQFSNEIAAIGQLNYIGQPLRKNVDRSFREGVEVEGWYKPFSGTTFNFNGVYNKSIIAHYTTDYDGMKYVNRQPLLTPKFIINMGIEQMICSKVNIGVTEKFISTSYLNNENTMKLPPYFDINGFVNYKITRTTKLLIGVNNVFNRNNYNAGYVDGSQRAFYVAPMRNFYMSVKQNF